MSMFTDKQMIGIAIVGAGVIYSVKKKADKIVTETLNPMSQNNAAYSAVNSIGAMASGNQHFNLGGWIYDVTHKGEKF